MKFSTNFYFIIFKSSSRNLKLHEGNRGYFITFEVTLIQMFCTVKPRLKPRLKPEGRGKSRPFYTIDLQFYFLICIIVWWLVS